MQPVKLLLLLVLLLPLLVLAANCAHPPTAPARCDTVVGAWAIVIHNPGPGQRVDSIPVYYDQCSRQWVQH